jgi:hypothetical protein
MKQLPIPIYDDQTEWNIVDTATESERNEWHPSNGPARRLCRCLEGLRDLEESVEHLLGVQNRSKRRRRLRSVVVPLHSLCTSTVDLLNSILSQKQFANRLPEHCGKDVARLISFLKCHVPFEGIGKLAVLRNKISAHYDRDMHPSEMRVVNLSVDLTEVAEWISILISVLSDVLKLDVFVWSGAGYTEGSLMIMCSEPLMTDFEVRNGNVVGINGCYLSKSPKWQIYAALNTVWRLSDRMFERSSRWRIKEFVEDKPGDHWSKIVRENRDS